MKIQALYVNGVFNLDNFIYMIQGKEKIGATIIDTFIARRYLWDNHSDCLKVTEVGPAYN